MKTSMPPATPVMSDTCRFSCQIARVTACLLLACLNTAVAGSAAEKIPVAAETPVELEGIDNKRHRLDEYIGQGKWVVLNIWGTACPPCREEMPELVRFHDQHHDKDAMVVGIAIAGAANNLSLRRGGEACRHACWRP